MTKYFILKDGRLFSASTAKTEEEANDACDSIGGDSVLPITEKEVEFIVKQFKPKI